MQFFGNFLGTINKVEQQHVQNMAQKQQQVKLIKNQYFFLSSKNFKHYDQDPDTLQIDFIKNQSHSKKINSIFFQCTGHGSFQQKQVAYRFLEYLESTFEKMQAFNVKLKIKIKLTGFDMDLIGEQFFQTFSQLIQTKITFTSSFELRVVNLQNVSADTLSTLMGIGIRSQNLIDLTNLSYEFSNWTFKKASKQDKTNQIPFDKFKEQIISALECKSPLNNLKKFRLQISTWYYKEDEYNIFFRPFANLDEQRNSKLLNGYKDSVMGGKKIQTKEKAFHYELFKMVKGLIQLMPSLMSLQLDFRNWHSKFEMNQLKKYFQNPDDIDLKTKVNVHSILNKVVSLSKLQKTLSHSKIFKPETKNNKQDIKSTQKQAQNQQDQDTSKLHIHMII